MHAINSRKSGPTCSLLGHLGSSAELNVLGRIDWQLTVDFDPVTETAGTYLRIREELGRVRRLHFLTPDQKIPSILPEPLIGWQQED